MNLFKSFNIGLGQYMRKASHPSGGMESSNPRHWRGKWLHHHGGDVRCVLVLLRMDSWHHELNVCKKWYKNNLKMRLTALLSGPHWRAPYLIAVTHVIVLFACVVVINVIVAFKRFQFCLITNPFQRCVPTKLCICLKFIFHILYKWHTSNVYFVFVLFLIISFSFQLLIIPLRDIHCFCHIFWQRQTLVLWIIIINLVSLWWWGYLLVSVICIFLISNSSLDCICVHLVCFHWSIFKRSKSCFFHWWSPN
jgi:hypothetical protein